jgi:predicted transposase/invertase (TIGR01784 family)
MLVVQNILKERVKAVNTLTKEMHCMKTSDNPLRIKDKISIDLNKETHEQLVYKPSLIQQKLRNNFDYDNNFRFTKFNQVKKIRFSNVLYKQFSIKVGRMQKYADPKNDLVFKKLFGEEKNKDLLIDFINKVLPTKHVKDIEYLQTNLDPDVRIKKQSILDVLCTDENGSKYIIEMQNAREKGFEKRAVYYASKTYANQMDKGGKYADLKEVIFIAITDFTMFPSKEDYFSIHNIRDIKTIENDLKDFNFAFIELPKFKPKDQERESGIELWCDLFKYAADRKEITTTDPIITKAYHTLEMSNWSQQDLIDYEAYQKILLDNQAREDFVRDEGVKIGIEKGLQEGVKIGIEKGLHEGVNIGIEKGLQEGRKDEKIEIARKMLKKGLDIDNIIDITGLTRDEIENIKSNSFLL